MNHNKKNYKWLTSYNNRNFTWGFHWNDSHHEWKNKQGKKSFVNFSNPATNEIMYCSYSMTTSEESTEEEEKGGYNSQETNIMSPNFSEMTGMNHQESLFFPTGTFLLFYDVGVDLNLAWEGKFLNMESEDKLQPVSQ